MNAKTDDASWMFSAGSSFFSGDVALELVSSTGAEFEDFSKMALDTKFSQPR